MLKAEIRIKITDWSTFTTAKHKVKLIMKITKTVIKSAFDVIVSHNFVDS